MVEEQGSKPSKFRYLKNAGRVIAGAALALSPACSFFSSEEPLAQNGFYLQRPSYPNKENPIRSLKFFLSRPNLLGILARGDKANLRLTSCVYGSNYLVITAEETHPNPKWLSNYINSFPGQGCDTLPVLAGFTSGDIAVVRIGSANTLPESFHNMETFKLIKTTDAFEGSFLGLETLNPLDVIPGQSRPSTNSFKPPSLGQNK